MTTQLVSYFVLVYTVWRLLSELVIVFIESLSTIAPTILISVAVISIAAAKMGDKAAQWNDAPMEEKQKLLLSIYASIGASAIAVLLVALRGLFDSDAAVYLNNLYGLGVNQPWVYAATIFFQVVLIRMVFGFFYTATMKDFSEG